MNRNLFSGKFVAGMLVASLAILPSLGIAQNKGKDRSDKNTRTNNTRNQSWNPRGNDRNTTRSTTTRTNTTRNWDNNRNSDYERRSQWNSTQQNSQQRQQAWDQFKRDTRTRDDRRNDWNRNNNRDRDRNWNNNSWDRNDRRYDDRYRSTTTRVYVEPRFTTRYSTPRYSNSANEWRNIATGAGLIAVIGLLAHDDTLTFAGAAGALYSLSRYESDRRSNDRECRLRAQYFSQPYFYRDDIRYERETVYRNGQQYYQFCRR